MRFGKAYLLALLVSVLLLGGTASAHAATVWYAAGGVATYDSGSLYLAYGVGAQSRMYPKQAPQDDDWVNSIYARQDDGDFVETGWYWTPGATNRIWFTVIRKNGYTFAEEPVPNVPVYAANSLQKVQLRRNNSSTDQYDIYVDGIRQFYWTNTGITSCRASVTSERYNTADYNRGAWQYVQLLTSGYTWAYWPHAGRLAFSNQDPSYSFYSNYVDRSDHYVYCDDHQN